MNEIIKYLHNTSTIKIGHKRSFVLFVVGVVCVRMTMRQLYGKFRKAIKI